MKKAQLSRYELDVSKPRPEVLHRIATALGASPLWLESGDVPVNDHEDHEDDGHVIPIDADTMRLLLSLATESGRSLSDEIAFTIKSAVDLAKQRQSSDTSSLPKKKVRK
jgi:transcriptional regulator with XRE-family HTH domain